MLYAKRQSDAALRRYHDITFERFWKRELDIEDPAVVGSVLTEAGVDTTGFAAYSAGEGREELDRVCRGGRGDRRVWRPEFRRRWRALLGREHLPTFGDPRRLSG